MSWAQRSWWFHFLRFGWYKRRQPCTSNEALALSDFIKQDSKVTVEHCPKSLHPVLFVFGGSHAMAFSTPHRAQSSTRVKRVCLKVVNATSCGLSSCYPFKRLKIALFHHYHHFSNVVLSCTFHLKFFSHDFLDKPMAERSKMAPIFPSRWPWHAVAHRRLPWAEAPYLRPHLVSCISTALVAAFSGVPGMAAGEAKRVTVESDRAMMVPSLGIIMEHPRWKSLNIIDELDEPR